MMSYARNTITLLFGAAFLTSAWGAIAMAQDDPDAVVTLFHAGPDAAVLDYTLAICPEECLTVRAICTDNGTFTLELAVEHERLLEWFENSPDDQPYPAMAELVIDDLSATFAVIDLAFSELNADWWAELWALTPSADFMSQLGEARTASIITPAFEIELSGAAEDAANRTAFADACSAF